MFREWPDNNLEEQLCGVVLCHLIARLRGRSKKFSSLSAFVKNMLFHFRWAVRGISGKFYCCTPIQFSKAKFTCNFITPSLEPYRNLMMYLNLISLLYQSQLFIGQMTYTMIYTRAASEIGPLY